MTNFFSNDKFVIKKYDSLLNQINFFGNLVKDFNDRNLKDEIIKLQKEYAIEQNLSTELIIKSFGLTREAAWRSLGLRHYNEQILGGLVLNDGKIAEMKTGEGKTLVATLPASLNALTKRGVHIITVNDYLAKRDAKAMVPIYRQLGLTVGLIQANLDNSERKKNYLADVTYVTSNEIGFDYLRDNMVLYNQEIVQRPFNYCIVDEVDAILIDEARTPLIISGQVSTDPKIYIQASEIAKYLRSPRDFEIDEKTSNIILTDQGIYQIEKILGLSSIFEIKEPWVFHVINALKAERFFLKNTHYIIRNNQIIIVDEFTGRIMPDRRWSNGLHEAIEAKENLKIQYSTNQLSSITYQNLFTLYPKLSGMTGTAKTAENELERIYNLEVFVIPTFKPFKRKDLPDKVYTNEMAKWKAVAKECTALHKIGRPVLIGTNTIEKSELLSILLNDYQLPHKVLNAKPENLDFESEIIAQAGRKSSITVATNMAGRGTDIILGGNRNFKNNQLLKLFLLNRNLKDCNMFLVNYLLRYHFSMFRNSSLFQDSDSLYKIFENELEFLTLPLKRVLLSKRYSKILCFYLKSNYKDRFQEESNYIKKAGGLCVIGTERHESRRIDNQLRGRAGRQGDPGSSIFFVSLEDRIFRLFGGDRIEGILGQLELTNDDIALESKLLNRSLDLAQKRVEDYYYDMRKNVYDYDQVLHEQRKLFYVTRSFILRTETIRNWIIELGEEVMYELAEYLFEELQNNQNHYIIEEDIKKLGKLLGFSFTLNTNMFRGLSSISIYNLLREQYWLIYDLKEVESNIKELGVFRDFEKLCLLQAIDSGWSEHLTRLNELRDSIGWRAYAQRDPLTDYKNEAYRIFQMSSKRIRNILVFSILLHEIQIIKILYN